MLERVPICFELGDTGLSRKKYMARTTAETGGIYKESVE
jgi:hypothetical protein